MGVFQDARLSSLCRSRKVVGLNLFTQLHPRVGAGKICGVGLASVTDCLAMIAEKVDAGSRGVERDLGGPMAGHRVVNHFD